MAGGTTPQGNDPWAPPQDAAPQKAAPAQPDGPGPYNLHDSQTVTAMPATPAPQAPSPYQAPQAPSPYQAPPPQPAPPVQHGGHVPPPPVSPAGPGLPAYGTYQGGPQYGYPAQQQMPYGGAPQYGWPGAAPMQPSNGIGVAGMVTGIVAAVLCLMWPLAIITGILGIVFGVIGRGKARRGEATNAGQALTGIICGSVGLVVGLGFLTLLIVAANS